MKFKELLSKAKAGKRQAVNELLGMYQPLLIKTALINGVYDDYTEIETMPKYSMKYRRYQIFSYKTSA